MAANDNGQARRRQRRRVIVAATAFNVAFAALGALVYVGVESWTIYRVLKEPRRGWSGVVHRSDPVLGFAPVAASRGHHTFPVGPDLAMRYDAEGFRVPVEATVSEANARPRVLALGCSFTYGDATPAEQTFAHRVGKDLGGVTRNAGVCSYGLSQMLLLSRELIAAHEPDWVLLQYSPWLVDRALQPYAPSYAGTLTNPYFVETAEGIEVNPPPFRAVLFDVPLSDYRSGEPSLREFARFFTEVGLPLVPRERAGQLLTRLGMSLGRIPSPARNSSLVVAAAYEEMVETARAHGAEAVIVVLGTPRERARFPLDPAPAGSRVVDAHAALWAALGEAAVDDADAYLAAYGHWRGDPPRLVDRHPNPRAHAIIADAILAEITRP